MIKVLCVVGTRPEAIKMAPVTQELLRWPRVFLPRICLTAQHREMLDRVLASFRLKPDIDLDLMAPRQSLSELTASVLASIEKVLETEKPDWVLVQGDTTTAMATALAAFYLRVPVGHIEAGLRTDDLDNPFPEEINRRLTGALATYHFAPTPRAKRALLREGVCRKRVFVTGNTVVDAINQILRTPPSEQAKELFFTLGLNDPARATGEGPHRKLIVVTAHRRESFGAPFESLCRGLRQIAERNPDVLLVYPVHRNPRVSDPVNRILAGHPRIRLIDPLPYEPFVRLMDRAYLILTDSGGIQEEASVLGKPMLVLREATERPEIIEAGIGRLVGTDESRLVMETERLLGSRRSYRSMAKKVELFGDGHAAERIVGVLRRHAKKTTDACT
jgi:UDP-N-acetylglucosamine 2-epimerase (non-hydrolysing)